MSDQYPPSDPYGQNPNEQPAYGQTPYGQAPQSAYGQPAYGQAPQSHPQATTILVLGILSLICCQVLGPVAWVMGNKAVKEVDASGGALGGRENANIGRILGIIGTVFLVLGILFTIATFAGLITLGSTMESSLNEFEQSQSVDPDFGSDFEEDLDW